MKTKLNPTQDKEPAYPVGRWQQCGEILLQHGSLLVT